MMRDCKPRMFIELHTQFIGHFGHNLTDFFEAIPSDIYRVQYKIDGVDHAWKTYEPGIEKNVTMPMLVWAVPR